MFCFTICTEKQFTFYPKNMLHSTTHKRARTHICTRTHKKTFGSQRVTINYSCLTVLRSSGVTTLNCFYSSEFAPYCNFSSSFEITKLELKRCFSAKNVTTTTCKDPTLATTTTHDKCSEPLSRFRCNLKLKAI